MYNHDQKLNYIDFYTSISESHNKKSMEIYLIRLFNRLEIYEQQLNKDLSMMNQQELDSILSKFLTGSVTTQTSIKSTLGNYFEWCLQRHLTVLKENYINSISIDLLDNFEFYKQDTVINEKELQQILDNTLQPIQLETVDILYRLYCHLLFNGVNPTLIFKLKEEDVNLKERTIKANNRIIYMSDILVDLIKYYLDMTYFVSYRKKNYVTKLITRNGYLLENSVSLDKKLEKDFREKMKKSFLTTFSMKLKYAEKNLNTTKIYTSGIFYRIYLKETKTGEVDLSEYLSDKKNNILTIDSPNVVKRRGIMEYTAWKKAFNL